MHYAGRMVAFVHIGANREIRGKEKKHDFCLN